MKNLMKILAVMIVVVVLSGCAGLIPPPKEEEKLIIGQDKDGNMVYTYHSQVWGPKQGPIRLAKAANTTPANAAVMGDYTRATVHHRIYGSKSQSDFDRRVEKQKEKMRMAREKVRQDK